MLKNIYRKEAIEYKKIHWKGKALLLAGIPAWLVTLLAFIFLIAIVLSLIFCTFTQRIDVRGEVITLPTPLTSLPHSRALLSICM